MPDAVSSPGLQPSSSRHLDPATRSVREPEVQVGEPLGSAVNVPGARGTAEAVASRPAGGAGGGRVPVGFQNRRWPADLRLRRRVRIRWYEYAPVMLIILASAWIFLIGIAAVVGPLHPDEKIRADAQKVLERLVGHGRRTNR
jgi:hypothetical protein